MGKSSTTTNAIYLYIVESTAFYPTAISAGFLAFAILILYLEGLGLTESISAALPFVTLESERTAEVILSTVAAGLISLVVFTYTMVMIILNRAATSYSPRVVPGLITQRSNQVILGFYLGTIVYSLVILVSIRPLGDGVTTQGTSVVFAVFFGIVSLGLFVYFIHSISKSVQVENIIERVHNTASRVMNSELETRDFSNEPEMPDSSNWPELRSPRSGYLQGLHERRLLPVLQRNDISLRFLAPFGSYVVKGAPYVKTSKPVESGSGLNQLIDRSLIFHREEHVEINYALGFRQITEIAVESISPALNDPGTAAKALDYLTNLFALRMKLPDTEYIVDTESRVRIILERPSFKELLYRTLTPIREYGKKDMTIITRLLETLRTLMVLDTGAQIEALVDNARMIAEDAQQHIENPVDRQQTNRIIKEL
ncbi:MAG: DUF2254 domain-containing protein, partial [Dehalococcoidia bacterium]|nr:DUF2254 domain-containing protein [Dehalococcoidia bacterium]